MRRDQTTLIAVLLASGAPFAAGGDAASPPMRESPSDRATSSMFQAAQSDEELDEVEVTGLEPLGSRDDIIIWLRRLAGRFGNEGTLDKGSEVLPVKGATVCTRVGQGPGTNCMIYLEAPGIQTNIRPGSFLLGVDLETPRVRYTSVDDTGVAVGTTGELRGDTAAFRTPCEASFARTCVSTTRITARPRSPSIRLRIELKMDGRVSARYDVTLTRTAAPQAAR